VTKNALLNKRPQRQLLKTDYVPNFYNLVLFTQLFEGIRQKRWFWRDT